MVLSEFIKLCEFFTPVLTNGFSLKSEWQQLSSDFQDSSEYSSRFLKCDQDGLNSFSDIQFLQSFFRAFGDHFKLTNNNWYHCQLIVLQLFLFSGKFQVLYLFVFFYFQFVVCWNGKIRWMTIFFFLINTRSDLLATIGWSVRISTLGLFFRLGLGDSLEFQH